MTGKPCVPEKIQVTQYSSITNNDVNDPSGEAADSFEIKVFKYLTLKQE